MAWIQPRLRGDGSVSSRVGWRAFAGRQRSETFRQRRQAEAYKNELERQMRLGSVFDPQLGKIALGQFWTHFIETSPPPSPSTRALYEMHGRRYLLPTLGGYQLRVLTKPLVKEFLTGLSHEGVGAPTVAAVHGLLRRMLSVAVDEGRIATNPALGIRVERPPRREMKFLTAQEVRALAEEVPPRYATLVFFLAFTGARIGEAAALRVKSLDLPRRRVQLVEAIKEVNGRQMIGSTKNKRARTLILPPFLAEKLSRHLEEFADAHDPEALVFPGSRGARYATAPSGRGSSSQLPHGGPTRPNVFPPRAEAKGSDTRK